jgi:LysM repeat protein
MKTSLSALIFALLIAGQLDNPVIASPQPASAYTCKDTYTVRLGDSLGAIARRCKITLADLQAANPEISQSRMIYPGQVLRIVVGARPPAYPNTHTVQSGDTLSAIAEKYDTTVKELIRVNPEILDPRFIYVDQVIRLPADIRNPRISLSADSVKPGWYLDVNVYGFPANADIDFWIGKHGGPYSPVLDGKTGEDGSAATFISFPNKAKAGEKWEVQVVTTEITGRVKAISETVTITD